jgi:hypothetical protein
MSTPLKSALKGSTVPASRSVVTPAKALETGKLSELNISTAPNLPKSELIKGVLKKNGYAETKINCVFSLSFYI